MKAVIYARVSTDEQAERGTSIEGQIQACKSYAQRKNIEVVGEYKDDYSGTTLERPEFMKMLDVLKKGGANSVIVYTMDRLSRDEIDLVTQLRTWHYQKIAVHFTDTGEYDYKLFHNRVISTMYGLSAEFELERIRSRTMEGKRRKIEVSNQPVLATIPPFGYYRSGQGKDGEYIINEHEARTIRMIFDLYTRGTGDQPPLSLSAICKFLDDRGIPRMTPTTKMWRPNAVRRILRKDIYKGVYVFGKTKVVEVSKNGKREKIEEKVPRSDWLTLEMPELAIVETGVWEIAQSRLNKNKQLSARNQKTDYLLSGHITCAECQRAMTGDKKKTKTNLFRYYRHRRKEAGSECERNGTFISAAKIEAAVWRWIVDLLTDPASLRAGMEELKSSTVNTIEERTGRLKELEKTKEGLEIQVSNYVDELTNHTDELTKKIIRQKIEEKSMLHQSLSREYAELQDEISRTDDFEEKERDIYAFAWEVSKGIEQAGYDEKRRILDLLDVRVEYLFEDETKKAVVSCVISPEKVCIEFPASRLLAGQSVYLLLHPPLRHSGRSRHRI